MLCIIHRTAPFKMQSFTVFYIFPCLFYHLLMHNKQLLHVKIQELVYLYKTKLLFLQENAGSCGCQRIPVRNTPAQFITYSVYKAAIVRRLRGVKGEQKEQKRAKNSRKGQKRARFWKGTAKRCASLLLRSPPLRTFAFPIPVIDRKDGLHSEMPCLDIN